MLTKDDLHAIGKVIDKKVSTDIAAIQARMADFEIGQITKIDLLELRHLMANVEKRVTAIEGKLSNVETRLNNTVTQEQLDLHLKKAFRGVVRKKDLKAMESRLVKKINSVLSDCDGRLLEHV